MRGLKRKKMAKKRKIQENENEHFNDITNTISAQISHWRCLASDSHNFSQILKVSRTFVAETHSLAMRS